MCSFVHWNGYKADGIGWKDENQRTNDMQLSMITNRGIKVWPDGFPETFVPTIGGADSRQCLVKIEKSMLSWRCLANALDNNIDTIKTENLYVFDGEPAFSLGQGQ